jgi:hypothetical protein
MVKKENETQVKPFYKAVWFYGMCCLLLGIVVLKSMESGDFASQASPDDIIKEMLVGTWVAHDDDPDVRTTYTFRSDNTGLFAFFDGALEITEYAIAFDGEQVMITYTMVAAGGEHHSHLTQEPVTVTCPLEYLSKDEFAIIRENGEVSKTHYKRMAI